MPDRFVNGLISIKTRPLFKLCILLAAAILIASSASAALASDEESNGSTAAKQLLIEVNGRPLTGPFSTAEKRGTRIFVPFTSIAKVFGDTVSNVPRDQIVSVRRHSGELVELDLRTMQIRENGSSILGFSDIGGINIPQSADVLMLPIEWTAAMLGVSIHFDAAAKVVRVSDGSGSVSSTIGREHGRLEIYDLDYEYNFNSYGSYISQNLAVRSTGRIGGGRYRLVANAGKGAGNMFGPLRSGTFTYEDASGRRFMAGDVSTSGEIQFLSANLRGISAQFSLGGRRVTAFAGRAASGYFPLVFDPDSALPNYKGLKYDTTVIGGFTTFGASNAAARRSRTLFSAGGMRFSGAGRSGQMAAANVNYASARFRSQADVAFGTFRGKRSDGTAVKGAGLAADISGSFDLTDNLTVQGRYTHISRNFLSPQAGVFMPVRSATAGVSWRPKDWLSATVYGGVTKRYENNKTVTDKNYSASVNIDLGAGKPSLYIAHTTSSSAYLPHSSYTAVNVSKDFSRFRAFVNASRIQASGVAAINIQAGANFRINEYNSLLVTQSVGSKGSLNGAADWYSSSKLNGRLSFSAGVGYMRNQSHLEITQRMSASMKLPRQLTLQATYAHNAAGSQMQVSIKGSLFNRKQNERFASVPVSEIRDFVSASGRVYHDTNLNGKYEPGIDAPLSNVTIRVDGNLYATSDQNGIYRIDNIKVGEHDAYIDLLSVRADLTILGKEHQDLLLGEGHDSTLDFRLVRTGRITGVIWNDTNENGIMDAGEEPLADVRVVFGAKTDALTDENGVFTIGDLPPGEHILTIDEKTLSDGYRAKQNSFAVEVVAGRETSGIRMAVVPQQAIVKVFN
jgi:hypothetical protein